jgi:proteasome lid subunit RPN8/RPN11
MWRSDFEYYAALTAPAGDAIANVRLDVDWVPAMRWSEFERELKAPDARPRAAACGTPASLIEPRWSASRGRPYVVGVSVRTNGSEPVNFPLTYFSLAASAAASQLVESGSLATGQRFDFHVYALPDAGRVSMPDTQVVAVDSMPDVDRAELALLLERAEAHVPHGITAPDNAAAVADTMPILIPQRVLEEARSRAEDTRDVETGGILVGKLSRDEQGRLFASVTAQISAEHTQATRASLRFTPRTWAGVDAAIRLRNRAEIPLGWWHSHPFFCAHCPPERRAVCPFSMPTFSRDDRHLHREVFQQPWSIALLLSFLGEEEPSYDVFAWSRGQIEAVPFFALPELRGYTGGTT